MAPIFEHLLIALLASLLVYTNKLNIWKYAYSREDEALSNLVHTFANSTVNYNKVAVGVNSNLDLIISAIDLFNQLGLKNNGGRDHQVLSSLEDFEECFSYYFQKCAAAERYVTSKTVFDKIISAAKSLQNSQYDIGGNAALMGLKMLYSNNQSTVLLGGPIGPELHELLPGSVVTIPLKSHDEYHLVLEYQKGDKWADHTSQCSNRFIVTHDKSNGEMVATKQFFDSLVEFKPDLVVVSGLHLLEAQSPEIILDKLKEVRERLMEVPYTVPIHLELASMTSADFITNISQQIFPVVDSIGLNEQELSFISTVLGGPGNHEELNQWPPEIGLMSDVIDWFLQVYGRNVRYGEESSRLTRLHFHCLTYHVIAAFPQYWSNNMVAVAAGSLAASKQACDKEVLRNNDVELRTPETFARSVNYWQLRRNLVKRDAANPVTSWQLNDVGYYFSAVLVCKEPKRTVGLGDCISATGLQYSKFLSK